MVFIRTFSPEDSRAEDQGLTWTCPPRAVFKLFGLGTSEGELDPTTASSFSSSGGSPRAPEHVLVRRGADPSRSDASIPPEEPPTKKRKGTEPNQGEQTHEPEPRRLEEERQHRREHQEPS